MKLAEGVAVEFAHITYSNDLGGLGFMPHLYSALFSVDVLADALEEHGHACADVLRDRFAVTSVAFGDDGEITITVQGKNGTGYDLCFTEERIKNRAIIRTLRHPHNMVFERLAVGY